MTTTDSIKRLINTRPEQPIPFAGDACRLSFAPGADMVGADVKADEDGMCLMTVAAPAPLVTRTLAQAKRALARSLGVDASAEGFEGQARARLGTDGYFVRLAAMVRQPLLSLAILRTQVYPFLAPEQLSGNLPQAGEGFAFQVRFLLRPRGELSSYDPVEMTLPPAGPARDARAPELLDALADALAERLTSQPPERHVNLLREEMANRFAENVEANGTRWEDYVAGPDFSMEAFKRQMTEGARTSLRRGMALDALAARLGVVVEDADLMAVASQVAAGFERTAIDAMLQSGQLPQLLEVCRRAKAREWLMSTAVQPRSRA